MLPAAVYFQRNVQFVDEMIVDGDASAVVSSTAVTAMVVVVVLVVVGVVVANILVVVCRRKNRAKEYDSVPELHQLYVNFPQMFLHTTRLSYNHRQTTHVVFAAVILICTT